jgi:hypothetical protein
MNYGIIFWGNPSYSHTSFLLKKHAIGAMLGYMVLCRNVFKELGILLLASWYLFSLLLFVSCNEALLSSDIDSHTIATRQSQDLHLPQANLTVYQKGVHYAGIKMFNKLPIEMSIYSNFKMFKVVIKHFLVTSSFYTVDVYFCLFVLLAIRIKYIL